MSTDPPSTREPGLGPRNGPSFPPISAKPMNHLNGSEVEGPLNRHNLPESTPTTPRPNTAPNIQPQPMHGSEDAKSAMAANFGAASSALANQRPLPLPFNAAASVPETVEGLTSTLNRGNSTRSNNSGATEDVDMDESDDESETGDGSRPKKKKKVRIFKCIDYPPCKLEFTRSEHLARHIRKHTGERPFTCHCNRKFSRMDNLRQHAQTVHVNETIPPDSLAASGTRYPRQPRNDRVRPSQNRPRAATASGHAPIHRGHQRNSQSTSSIASFTSTFSQTNSFRGRPPPLKMGTWAANSPSTWRPSTPGEYTPNSATFSTAQNSPRFPSGVQSPTVGPYSRPASYHDGHLTLSRRSSVPAVANPFSSSGLPYHSGTAPTFSAAVPYPPGMVSSPATSSAGMGHVRRESMPANHSDMDSRRRTWHPDTASTYNSRMQYVMTSNHPANGPVPRPSAILPSNAPPMEPLKLPGISSFDPIIKAATSPHRAPSPMMIDRSNSYHPLSPTMVEFGSHRQPRPFMVESTSYRQPRPMQVRDRPLSSHLEQQFNHLEIQSPPHGDAAMWASDTARAVHATAEQSKANQPRVMFDQSTYGPRSRPSSSYHQHTASAPVNAYRPDRRDGWYHGPATYRQAHDYRVQGTSPEGSSSSEGAAPITPQSATTADYNPAILRSNGHPEETPRVVRSQQPIIHQYNTQSNGSEPSSYTYGPPSSNQNMFQPQHLPKPSEQTYRNGLDTLAAVAIRSDQNTF
ncbi:hypothetical protein DSL72_003155 [Monilinia vaccinii-corymbosi]|uniref:C2H2-type domain-containing protein n=1 Tax=Monilinia vaccinii-corymbosi TaxID=61207 RepID=A0A8A3P0F4_9HELO|nr:hypothetical protein DSL72_003155 [Monilinia vaccinii-corymbosi]